MVELEVSHGAAGAQARLKAPAVIRTERDIIDLIGNASFSGADGIVLEVEQLDPAFYDLRSGLFGELGQKLANYRLSLTLVGELGHIDSESFRAFMRESNRGSLIRFTTELT